MNILIKISSHTHTITRYVYYYFIIIIKAIIENYGKAKTKMHATLKLLYTVSFFSLNIYV